MQNLTPEEKLEIEECRQETIKCLKEAELGIRELEDFFESTASDVLEKMFPLVKPNESPLAKIISNIITKIWNKIKWIFRKQTLISKQ